MRLYEDGLIMKNIINKIMLSCAVFASLSFVSSKKSTSEALSVEIKTYVKVDENLNDFSGTYLIINESNSACFNGSLNNLDITNNIETINIEDTTITGDYSDYEFVITSFNEGYSIKAKNGNYIGIDSDINGVNISSSELINNISFNEGNVDIKGQGGAYLRYNTTNKQFKYYKSSIYTTHKEIQLYKLTEQEIETCNPSDVQSLINKHIGSGKFVKETSINIDTSNTDAINDFSILFHGKVTDLKRITYYNDNELWMTNKERTINSGYGTDEQGNMTHFTKNIITGENTVDYTVLKGQEKWNDPNVDGMEGYYITPNDFVIDNYFTGWQEENGAYVYNLNGYSKNKFLSDFINVVAPLFLLETLEDLDLQNYFFFKKLVVKEESDKLKLQILIDENDVAGKLISSAGNVLAEAIIYEGELDLTIKELSFSSSKVTGEGTILEEFKRMIGPYADVLIKVTTSGVSISKGTIKANANGYITLVFDSSVTFKKAYVGCRSTSNSFSAGVGGAYINNEHAAIYSGTTSGSGSISVSATNVFTFKFINAAAYVSNMSVSN